MHNNWKGQGTAVMRNVIETKSNWTTETTAETTKKKENLKIQC